MGGPYGSEHRENKIGKELIIVKAREEYVSVHNTNLPTFTYGYGYP